ncbi:sugar phosphate isomerase/epimerase family protein [Vagococcus elongatus]|uniref:Xylose isomerase n=1 Tax=Vagococcus elongatus TaxID=180344 RepID=A0A430AQX7_9ENTE|nr:TIM barrel protein [Vagococcus elongatus]RSU10509.1 xylose isomerase [Vagococcus elongatus]
MTKIKTGVILFSFGTLFLNKKLDLEGVIRTAAEIGAEGYDIVAAQSIPTYPYVSDEFVEFVNECKSKYGIGPMCYSAQLDRGMLKERDLTEEEALQQAITSVISASKLGCTVMREQYLLSPASLEKLAPYAEAYNVRVGIEIHNPESPITPAILEYLEVIERTKSKFIGFIPDFGAFATGPNKPIWDRALSKGATTEQLKRCAQLKYDEVSKEDALKIMDSEIEKTPALLDVINSFYGFVQFKKDISKELEGLKRIMPYVFSMHGKFHYVDENLHEPAIPYEEIIPVIEASGYDGYIVTEYEDEGGYDAIEQCHRHIAMIKKLTS